MFLSILALITGITVQPHSQIHIITKNPLGKVTGSGSGVVIEKNKVLTAYHVLRGEFTAFATCGDKEIELKPIISSAQLDLSIVEFAENCDIKPIVIAKENAPVGSDLYSLGYPAHFGFMVTKGIVSSYKYNEDKTPRMWSDIKVWYGNSGGPVVNSQGELVGITQAIMSDSTVEMESKMLDVNSIQFAMMAPVSVIKLFLSKVPAK